MAIDLRSDTVTRPSEAMREAARDADVGDDVYKDDPTVNELERRAAAVLGKEAALYVPSGTMGNQIAARTHTERGQEALVEYESHVYKWEVGGFADLSSLQVRPIDAGEDACPTPESIRDAYVEESVHEAGTGLLTIENTHNSRGGVAVPVETLDTAAETAHDLGLPVHLDGARLFNAATALDTPAERVVRKVDTVMFCLSKGLGAPVGSMLVGPEEFVERARRVRKLFGGGMRQAGMIAAPGILALENRDRLDEDHDNAAYLATELDGLGGLRVPEPDTNIVLIHTDGTGATAGDLLGAFEDAGVLGSGFGEYTIRFCTHWDVDRSDIDTAVDRVRSVVEG